MWKTFVHLPDCFSVLRLFTLGGFGLNVIFTWSCSGLFFFFPQLSIEWELFFPLFLFSLPYLRQEKSNISLFQTLGITGRAEEERSKVFALQKWCSELWKIHNLSWKVCVHSQVVKPFETVKHWVVLMLHKMAKYLLLKYCQLLLCSRMYGDRYQIQRQSWL